MERIISKFSPEFVSIKKTGLVYGPLGKMILKNLKQQWHSYLTTTVPFTVFSRNDILDMNTFIRKIAMNNTTIGVINIENSNIKWNRSIELPGFNIVQHEIAKFNIFQNAVQAKDTFRKLQRVRRSWWRKLSQWPSRFIVTEEIISEKYRSVEVQAQFSFGTITVEKIIHISDVPETLVHKNQGDAMDTQIVEHITSLDWGCLTLFSDTYVSSLSGTMYLHPRLVPYKVALFTPSSEDKINHGTQELYRFVLYVNNILKSRGLDTILTSGDVADKYLVPLHVLVNRTSLENGIIQVVNRSTSLGEDVHITGLVEYILKHTYY